MLRFILVLMVLVSFQTPAFAMSPKINHCATMASLANIIIESKNSKSEKQAYDLIRRYELPGMHVDLLDGLVVLVYQGGVKARAEEVALTMYLTCAMKS